MSRDTPFVNGAARLSQRIRTISTALALPVLTNEIGNLLLRRTLDRFDRGVDPDGNPWAELSESTMNSKLRLGFTGRKLVRTGSMRASIQRVRGNITGSIFTNTGAGVRLGIEDPKEARKGNYHNRGTKNMPQRRFLGIGALDVKSVDSFLRRRADQVIG